MDGGELKGPGQARSDSVRASAYAPWRVLDRTPGRASPMPESDNLAAVATARSTTPFDEGALMAGPDDQRSWCCAMDGGACTQPNNSDVDARRLT
jgi:hypothetical protein